MDDRPAPRLLVIGGISIDHITTADGATHLDVPGGNAIFAAFGASVWGVEPSIVGLVGNDYPEAWIDRARDAGIDTRGLQRHDGPHETQFAVRYASGRDREPFVPSEAFKAAGQPVPVALQRMAALIDSSPGQEWASNDETRTKGWRTDPDLVPDDLWTVEAALIVPAALDRQRTWAQRCRERMRPGGQLYVDPEEEQGRDLTLDDLAPLLATADAFLPSERQMHEVAGAEADPTATARRLAELGPAIVAIKLGASGSLVYDRRSNADWRVPAVSTEVRDVTGAGDAYCGGFAAGLLTTGDPLTAALYGSVSASLAIEGFGVFEMLAHGPDEAERRLETLRDVVARNEWFVGNSTETMEVSS